MAFLLSFFRPAQDELDNIAKKEMKGPQGRGRLRRTSGVKPEARETAEINPAARRARVVRNYGLQRLLAQADPCSDVVDGFLILDAEFFCTELDGDAHQFGV